VLKIFRPKGVGKADRFAKRLLQRLVQELFPYYLARVLGQNIFRLSPTEAFVVYVLPFMGVEITLISGRPTVFVEYSVP